MVAHTATSPDRGTPSGDTTLPRPTVHAAGDLFPLHPTASLGHSVTQSLLDDLTSPHHSLASVAEKHNLTLSALLTWLDLPSTQEQMAQRETVAYRHVRFVAAVNLSTAVHTTVKLLDTYNKSAPAADPFEPATLRAAIHARKAAWQLYRFSRAVPINEADLTRARTVLRATVSRAAVSRASDCDVREPTTASTHATPSTTRRAVPDSETPRQQSEPVANSARTPPSAPSPLPLDQLVAHLSSIATSLGIDISDLDHMDDPAFADPPEGGSTHAAAALAATGPPHPG